MMQVLRLLTLLGLAIVVGLGTGCNNQPPEDVPQMEVIEDDESEATEAAPAEDATPAADEAKPEGSAPAEDAAPATDEAKPEGSAPAEDAAPATDEAKPEGSAPAEDAAPAADEAKPEGSAPAKETAEPAMAEASGTVTYVIEPNMESELLWTGYKTTGSREGGFADFSGTVTVPNGDITQGGIALEVSLPSLFSDSRILTGQLKGDDWFEIAEYATATFTSEQIEETEDGYKVTGEMAMHGITKKIAFPAQIDVSEDALTASSEFTLLRSLWGIDAQGYEDQLIRDDVLVKFNISAPAQADEGDAAA